MRRAEGTGQNQFTYVKTGEKVEESEQTTRTLHRMLDHHQLEGRQLGQSLVLGVVFFFSLEEVVEAVDDA